MAFIQQMEPWIGEEEKGAIAEYLDSGGWLTEFKKTREFENRIREYTGARYCHMMPNGTLSLTAALIACGIGKGDDVLVPDYTMAATPNAVVLAGANPVFVDIERDSLCIDFEDLVRRKTPASRAMMLVSINGRVPSRMTDILEYCQTNDIRVIEDAAQSLGSFYLNKHLGRLGLIGSFSFSAPKIITTGQGGALITDDEECHDRISKIRDFGRTEGGSDHYLTMGWNLKFTDLQAVIGIEQMKKLPWRVERKKEIYQIYKNHLADIESIEFIRTSHETSPWFIDILTDRRRELMAHLKKNHVGSRPFYPPLHAEPVYNLPGPFPAAEEAAQRGLWLPSSSKLKNEDIVKITRTISEFLHS